LDDNRRLPSPDKPVFLHYSQAELDRNFDQRGWASNASEVVARWARRSEATRGHRPHRTGLRYGPGEDETLDVFPAEQPHAPVLIFVHGGAWLRHTKADFSFVAETFAASGMHTVVLNFTNLPTVRLPEMVAQVQRGVEWVWRNADGFGGDRDRLHLAGHSSGAHLSVITLTTDWAARGLPADVVKGACFLSGLYDMAPVLLSARSSYVHLNAAEAASLNPMLLADAVACPLTLFYAERDTDEFRRQNEAFAHRLAASGRIVSLTRMPGLNHFEIMEQLGLPQSALGRAVLAPDAGWLRTTVR
jgi:arylformamidase